MRGLNYRGYPFHGGRYPMTRRPPYHGPPYAMGHSDHPSGPGPEQQKGTAGGGFQRVYPVDEKAEKLLNEAILQRHQDITPTPSDQADVSALMSKIQAQLDALVLNPASFEPCQIEEVKQVGSYKTQTMIREKNQADIVIVLRTLPTKEAVCALCNKLLSDYRQANRNEWVQSNITDAGFDIAVRQASLRCLIATIPMNLALLDNDIHVPSHELIERHLAAVRHIKWFDENANNTSLRALVRILRDIRQRFQGLMGLNPWMLLLLAHHALISTPSNLTKPGTSQTENVGLAPVFRRCFQLLAGGIFLPGAAGIPDPCGSTTDSDPVYCSSVHESMSYEEMDQLTFTAQTLLRVNSHGGYRHILGLEGNDSAIATDMSIFSSIVVTASEAAYDSEEHMQWQQEDEMELPPGEASPSKSNGEKEDANKSNKSDELEKEVEAFMATIRGNGTSATESHDDNMEPAESDNQPKSS